MKIRCCDCSHEYDLVENLVQDEAHTLILRCPHCGSLHSMSFRKLPQLKGELGELHEVGEVDLQTYVLDVVASRFGEADRTPLGSADDQDITGWVVGTDFILAVTWSTNKGPMDRALRVEWRNVTDEGTFAPVGATGEITYNADTVIVDEEDIAWSERICTTQPSGYTWVLGYGNEGDNTIPDTGTITYADDTFSEHQCALACDGAHGGDEYEFRLYDTSVGVALGTCACTLTMAAAEQTLQPGGIASGEAFGIAHEVNLTIEPSGVASGEALGSPKLDLTIFPDGIAGAEAFGTHNVAKDQVVEPSGIASGEAFSDPAVSVQAATLGNFIGVETGGLEEFSAIQGSPSVVTSPVRTGTYAVQINANCYVEVKPAYETWSNGLLIGFAMRFDAVSPSGGLFIFNVYDGVGLCMRMALNTSNKLLLLDANSSVIDTGDTTIQAEQWYYMELYWEYGESGDIELYLDGSPEGSGTSEDLSAGGSLANVVYRFPLVTGASQVHQVDDIYSLWGCSSISDRFGIDTKVTRACQNTVEDATDQGDALDQGTWADVGDTPIDEEGTPAGYTTTSPADGHTICDEGSRPGPSGISGIGEVKGAKWIHRMKKTSDTATTHEIRYGHNGDTAKRTITPTTAFANYFTILGASASQCPTASEYFAQGFAKSGAEYLHCAEIWACLLYTGELVVEPSGIASAEALGTPQINLTIEPSGIVGAEAFGSHNVAKDQVVEPGGVASAEALGTPKVNLEVQPSGVGSAEALGTPKVNLTVEPSSIAGAEAFGSHSIIMEQFVEPGGIESAEALGEPTAAFVVQPSGVAGAEAFGTHNVAKEQFVEPGGVASEEALGTPQVNLTVEPSSIAGGEAFGTHSVIAEQFVEPDGIVSAEALGLPNVAKEQFVEPSGVVSAEALGEPEVSVGEKFIDPSGIPSAEALGTPEVNLTIEPSSVPSGEALGTPKLVLYLLPSGIISAEALGSPTIALVITPTGIPSGEALGTPVVFYDQVVEPTGVVSGEALGEPEVLAPQLLEPEGIASGEALGTPELAFVITPSGVASGEAFGTPKLILYLQPIGIVSGEALGAPHVLMMVTYLSPSGIPSGEAFGTPFVVFDQVIIVTGIASMEALGSPVAYFAFAYLRATCVIIRGVVGVAHIVQEVVGEVEIS